MARCSHAARSAEGQRSVLALPLERKYCTRCWNLLVVLVLDRFPVRTLEHVALRRFTNSVHRDGQTTLGDRALERNVVSGRVGSVVGPQALRIRGREVVPAERQRSDVVEDRKL